jgi:hypothetical protein
MAVVCPFCRSTTVELISLFGSQLLLSQYRCSACRSYFEGLRPDRAAESSIDSGDMCSTREEVPGNGRFPGLSRPCARDDHERADESNMIDTESRSSRVSGWDQTSYPKHRHGELEYLIADRDAEQLRSSPER